MKKVVAISLALVFVLSLSVTVFAAGGDGYSNSSVINGTAVSASSTSGNNGVCPCNEDCPYGEQCINNGTCPYDDVCQGNADCLNSGIPPCDGTGIKKGAVVSASSTDTSVINTDTSTENGVCPYNENCPYREQCINNGTCLYDSVCQDNGDCHNNGNPPRDGTGYKHGRR